MKRKAFHISNELFKWATDYVARKQIRGPQGNISFSELVRQLLKTEKEKEEKRGDDTH